MISTNYSQSQQSSPAFGALWLTPKTKQVLQQIPETDYERSRYSYH